LPKDKVEALPPLKEVINTYGLRAKKSLGQNFLLDINLTQKIAQVAGALDKCTVIEIGPGPGGLTRALFLEGAKRIVAIEQDARAVQALQSLEQAAEGGLRLIEGDALKFDYASIITPKKIVANLPYNISTVLLIKWLENADQFESLTLMFQKEVADRLTAEVGSSSYGRLSVMTQWCSKVKRCFDIPPEAFVPVPKIISTVVMIEPFSKEEQEVSFKTLEKVTKVAFNQRRKMIRSSLKGLWGDDIFAVLEEVEINPQLRAENLSIKDFVKLAKKLEKEDAKI